MTTDAQRYPSEQPVSILITVANETTLPLTLSYRNGQQFDALVYRGDPSGELVWQWSAGMFFTQALWDRTLAPGEILTFGAAWDQTDLRGRRVPPGQYAVVGRSTSSPGGNSPAVSISLERDAPAPDPPEPPGPAEPPQPLPEPVDGSADGQLTPEG